VDWTGSLDENEIERLGLGGGREKKVRRDVAPDDHSSKEKKLRSRCNKP
jgi:hypothetical protein